jgi:calcium-dependent protein kinase
LFVGFRHIEEERVADAFDRLDSDDSGFISKENLREFLGSDATLAEVEKIMKDCDEDDDGKSKQQFSYYGCILL